MSEGGVRTFLTLGPAGLAFEVESEPTPSPARALSAKLDAFKVALSDGLTLTFGAGTYVEGDTCSFFAGDPRAPRRGKKRPGQWTDRTRAKRARRLEKARARALRTRWACVSYRACVAAGCDPRVVQATCDQRRRR